MSWSVSAVGKAKAVAASIESQFGHFNTDEPEQSIKSSVASMIATTLASFADDTVVKVEASGSQYKEIGRENPRVHNTVRLIIEPVWGFLE